MFYLADVGIFLVLVTFVLVGTCWSERVPLLLGRYGSERVPFASHLESDVLSFSTVWGVVALLSWLAGSSRLHSDWTGWFFPLVIVSSLTSLKREGRANISQRWRVLRSGLGELPALDKALIAYVAAVCALTFVFCLVPPSSGDYDSLMYHLAVPQRYLEAGRVVELPYDHHSYFPLTVEMWFALGLSLKGPVLAKLFHWMMMPLSCAALWAFGRRNLSVRAASWAAALWVSLPVVQSEATTAYIDLGFTLWVILAFGCAANWRETNDDKWLAWSGAFAGFALGTKYLGALTVFFIGVWALIHLVRTRTFPVRPLVYYTLLSLLLGGGWYFRNAAWTGNPVYPFAYGLFGGKGWTAQMAADYSRDQGAYGFGRGLLDLIMVPWRLSMSPLNYLTFVNTPQGQQLMASPQPWWPLSPTPLADKHTGLFESAGLALQIFIGPVLLAFGLPALFVRGKPAALGLWLSACAFFALFWFPTGQYLRYLLPAFALFCLPCGWMIARLENRAAFLRSIATGCLVLWFLFVPLLTIHQNARAWEVIAGRVTPESYLARTFGGYQSMQWLNSKARQSTVAVYGEPRCFYLRAPYFWADDPHNNLVDYARVGQDGAALVEELRRLGASYVLWNTDAQKNGGFGGPPTEAMNDAVARGLLRSEYEANGYQVLSIEKEAS